MIKSIKINDSEMEYISFWTWKKVFVIIPWLSIKSVLTNENAIISSFSKFSNEFTIYLFDRLKDIPDNYSIKEMAEDTYAVMQSIWIKSCNIFWASQWWMIAQCIAINHPNFVEKMILWSTTYKIDTNSHNILSHRIELAKNNNISELINNFIDTIYCKETINQYWKEILQSYSEISNSEIQKFIKLTAPTLNFNVEKDLWRIKCETLIVASKNDKIFWRECAKTLSDKIQSQLYLYEEYGHAVYDEAPDFRDKMLHFLLN